MQLTTHYRRTVVLFMVACVAPAAHAQLEDEDDGFRAGLIGEYTDDSGHSFRRVDSVVAFNWDDHQPDPRLSGDRFQVAWKGFLMSQAPGEYRFRVFSSGHVTFKLGEAIVLDAESTRPQWHETDPIELSFDYHPIRIEYQNGQAASAHLALFWSGPRFGLEPIGSRQLYHDPQASLPEPFERGELLVRALRCAACHEFAGETEVTSAPALDRLNGNVRREWLVDWLSRNHRGAALDLGASDRMPRFGWSVEEAAGVANLLMGAQPRDGTLPRKPKAKKGVKIGPDAGAESLFTLGCLACHQHEKVGNDGLFAGGRLTEIAAKRPASFFHRWLENPESINVDHRMPVFDLSTAERWNLAAYLSTLGDASAGRKPNRSDSTIGRSVALKLLGTSRCVACHRMPEHVTVEQRPARSRIHSGSNWRASCLSTADRAKARPGYELGEQDARAVVDFVSRAVHGGVPVASHGKYLMKENNCLACHARGSATGLGETATQVASERSRLAPMVPGMTPPSLDGVGDKLNDDALAAAILRKEKTRRDYLLVRMPRFRLTPAELASITRHLVDTDRVPDRPEENENASGLDTLALEAAGSRLVTSDGFGCTSCHQVGSAVPVKAPLNARGPGLSMLGQRIRRTWFDRFVRNPARIVPRMEMPSIRVAVQGTLDDNVDRQLAAVWDVLNRPDFQPPKPNPVRIVRRSGDPDRGERAVVVTDVLRVRDRPFIKPLLVGLPNRHNLLLDLATAKMVHWSIGDVARQQTEGKTWYWEASGTTVLDTGIENADVGLIRDGQLVAPTLNGQFMTEFDSIEHVDQRLVVRYRLHFATGDEMAVLRVAQDIRPLQGDSWKNGIRRRVQVEGIPEGARLRLEVLASDRFAAGAVFDQGRAVAFSEGQSIRIKDGGARFRGDGSIVSSVATDPSWEVTLDYATTLQTDRFPLVESAIVPAEIERSYALPGFEGVRLPITSELMPTALAWRPNGELAIASLKGRVWLASDTDSDGLEDSLRPFSDELAAPYGLVATDDHVDAVNKYGVLRLEDTNGDGQSDRMSLVASGWGHTADYHDWAVGLPVDSDGNYYVALPCQQDERPEAAAAHRGQVLQLVPRSPSIDDPRRYKIKTISAGHRFPMGIARNRGGAMFVTDNQGNYNPFNELNHVRQGRRFGFINSLERKPGFSPPLTEPAIDIPHPWTRSVNGICFLETPETVRKTGDVALFGPFEGHLVGCEYDTRRLVRLSLQKVGDTYQGAAYPFSLDEPADGPPLLGPLVCAIAPDGALCVGGIRDSGWGAGNNVGELVRFEPNLSELPCGITEVRATPTGFEIDFSSPVDREFGEQVGSYAMASYRRVSTPAYGGSDKDRRTETPRAVQLSADGQRAAITMPELREGYVYEFRLRNLSPGGKAFFPAEAYYTLRAIP